MADMPSSADDPRQRRQQFLDDDRREALGRLVEQHELGIEHQRAGDRQHLLLAAGELVAEVGAALLEAREHLVGPRHGPGARTGDGRQVLLDGQRLEDVALLRHPADPGERALVGTRVAVRSRPPSVIEPPRWRVTPMMVLSSVVLPVPLRPSTASDSPGLQAAGRSSR